MQKHGMSHEILHGTLNTTKPINQAINQPINQSITQLWGYVIQVGNHELWMFPPHLYIPSGVESPLNSTKHPTQVYFWIYHPSTHLLLRGCRIGQVLASQLDGLISTRELWLVNETGSTRFTGSISDTNQVGSLKEKGINQISCTLFAGSPLWKDNLNKQGDS